MLKRAHLQNFACSCWIFVRCRVESIPFEEFEDVYLLDFVGPPGFVKKTSSKAKRYGNMSL